MNDVGLCTTAETYDKNAQVYIKRTCALEMGTHIDKFYAYLRGASEVLSVGCGYGKDEAILSEKGVKITGIDLSRELLAEAKRRVPRGNFIVMDMRSTCFDENFFHGVYCCASVHHLQHVDVPFAMREMQRVLVPNGVLYICVKEGAGEEWRPLGSGQVRETFFARDEFESILKKSGLDIIEFYPASNRIAPNAKPWLNYFCRK